jgi:hypothetical protein
MNQEKIARMVIKPLEEWLQAVVGRRELTLII